MLYRTANGDLESSSLNLIGDIFSPSQLSPIDGSSVLISMTLKRQVLADAGCTWAAMPMFSLHGNIILGGEGCIPDPRREIEK